MAAPLASINDEISPQHDTRLDLEVKFQDDEISSISDEFEHRNNKPKIPDGGWGWMVVFSSLILSLIQDGISFSFGILYIEFKEEFQASDSATSWIGSLFISIPLLTGPIMSALVDKYGCRNMTILGGLISASGFILSSFAKSIYVMYITFGLFSGLGLGLTYITAVVSIAFWFEKKRNLAVGLGACGTGIGTFVYAPFTTFLLYEFGWKWTVRLLAGTLLNICVCGALMRDPDWIKEQDKAKSSKSSTLSLASSSINNTINLDEIRLMLKKGENVEYIMQTLATSLLDEDKQKVEKEHQHSSVLNLPTFIKQNEAVPLEVLEQLSSNQKLYKVIVQNYPSLLHCRSSSEKGLNKISPDNKITRIPVTFSLKLKKKKKRELPHQQYSLPENPQVIEPLLLNHQNRKKISVQSQNYFRNMRFPRHSLIHRGAILNKNKYRLRASSCPNIYRVSMATLATNFGEEEEKSWHIKILKALKELFDFSLFLEFHFFLMSLSTVILFSWFMTPYFYLADHMDLSNYSKKEASYVMSAIGITNTIGMVAFGWAGDQKWCNVTKTYALCMVLCGICCSAIMYFTYNYYMLMVSSALYGIFLASSFSFTPIILVELLPLETFTKAYGLTLLCQGIGHLGGPPLAGLLYDYTKTWSYSFHLSGIWIIISGLLILVIPYTNNRKMIGKGPVEKELEKEIRKNDGV